MRERCIGLEERVDWEAAIADVPHAFAHTWQSCRAAASGTGHWTYLYVVETETGRAACPISEREFEGHLDIYTPYGFSGFIGCAGAAMTNAWRDFVTRRGYVCGYFGLNPLLPPATPAYAAEFVTYNSLYVLDLTQTLQHLRAKLHTNRRRDLANYDALSADFCEDRDQLEAFFQNTAPGFFQSRGAAQGLPLTRETIHSLFTAENAFAVGAVLDRAVQAVTLFGFTPWIGEFLFNVSTDRGRRYSTALLWYGAQRLKSLGVPVFNLGGGARAGDGIAAFKARFGGREVLLQCARAIYRPDVYAMLCTHAGVAASASPDFFPPYHRSAHR